MVVYLIYFFLLLLFFISLVNPKIGLYFFIASLPLELLVSNTFLTIPKVLGIIALVSFLFHVLKNRTKFRSDKTTLSLFLFLSWGSLSYFWSAYKDLSLTRIFTIFQIVIMYFLIINELDSKKSIDDLMKFSIFGGAILGFSGLYQIIQSGSNLQRISGISTNANIYFIMALFLIPSIYWNLVNNKSKSLKFFTFVVMLVLFFTSLFTQSRGGILSLGIFMISYLIFTRKKFSWISILLITFLAIVVIAPDNLWMRFVDQGYSASFDRFITLWPTGIEAARNRLLTGYGIGVSAKIMSDYLIYHSEISVHNSLLALLIDLGLPGAFLYLLSIAFPTIQIFKMCCISKKAHQTDYEKFGVLLFCALLAYLASWFKSGGFEYFKYLWVLVGFESSLVWLIKKERTINAQTVNNN